jgi:hypothetical protein
MNRAEHVAWCQTRALEYVDMGQLNKAVTSMSMDIQKHEIRTKADFDLIIAGTQLLLDDHTERGVRDWIARFN